MVVEFNEIAMWRVGYAVPSLFNPLGDYPRTRYILKEVTFGEFISPFTRDATSREDVYRRLENRLTGAYQQLNCCTDGKRTIHLQNVASQALERETLLNAMDLLRRFYMPNIDPAGSAL